MANLALVFDILARDNASKSFRDVGNSAERAGKQGSTAGNALAGGMKIAAAGLLGSGIIAGFKSLYDAAAESQKIGRLTEQVIKTTGGAAGVSAKQVSDLAAAIAAKTGVDDEAIQSGQNLLLTFTNVRNEVGAGNDIFSQATQAVTDMSVALGKDAPSSAIMLGKALNDPIKGITALSRAGVSFTEQQKDQIRTLVESGDVLGAQKIILAELGKEFGGAAEAAATPLDKLRVRAGNLAEQVGGYLVPAIDRFATFADAKLLPILEDAGTFLNATLVPAVKGLATGVGFLADVWNSLPGPVQVALVALGAIAALKGPVSSALETIALRSLYMKDAIVGAGTGMGGLKAAGSGLVGFLGGPWGLAIAGATVGLSLLTSWMGKSDEATEEAQAAQRGFADALRESKGVIDENVRSAAAKAAQDAGLLDVAERVGIGLNAVTEAIVGNGGAYDVVRQQLEAYIGTQGRTVVSGRASSTVLTEEGEAAQRALESLNLLAGTGPATAESQRQLAEATATGSDTMETFAQKIEAARSDLDDAKRATDDFKLSLDILTGETVSLIQVESAFQAAAAAAQGAMKDLGGEVLNSSGALNLQSENGRKAADVLLDVRNSGNDVIATMIQQSATAEDVAAKEDELRKTFIATAGQMGITGEKAETLADQILGIPDQRDTAITADTGQASGAVSALQAQIDGLRGKTVTVKVVGDRAALATYAVQNGLNTVGGYADGGYTGDGSKWDIAGLVHRGEFVFTKEQTARLGAARLEAIANAVPGYVDGGLVVDFESSDLIAAATALGGSLRKAMSGVAGGGALGGTWHSIFNAVKAVIPQARANSTFRPGDPGYHGRNKAVDFGFGSGPGGAGSAGLASINRLLHDRFGRNLAELIYDGVGDDRPDLKNGRPLTYSAGTRAAHRNHVHAAVYDSGGLLPPGLNIAYNGTGKPETVRTPEQEAALQRPLEVTVYAQFGEETIEARATRVVIGALTSITDRGRYNP